VNQLNISLSQRDIPMIYPFLTERDALRKHLIDSKIFVAKYWPNVLEWVDKNSIEYYLANNILPLPIDQRYDDEDMNRILDILKN
ncbi:MAG: hypothetical protein J1E29_07690, partial [Duncaniella sp.]|nr:hypothetical protein [Duncaniella sp.]